MKICGVIVLLALLSSALLAPSSVRRASSLSEIQEELGIQVKILNVTISQYVAYRGAILRVDVIANATWDVIDFDAFSLEAFYDNQTLGTHSHTVFWQGNGIINDSFVWNTAGVGMGSHSISAKAYWFRFTIDTYFDGSVQILPPYSPPVGGYAVSFKELSKK